jgi:AhpD family alkylhydroperoxidase
VTPVRPSAAGDLVGQVYAQVVRDFGLLAPPVVLHSPSPAPLAACWLMLREILIVPGPAGRAAKEAVAAAVSLENTCPFCVTIHTSILTGLTGTADATALAGRPPYPPDQAPELIGTTLLLHYLNRMVNVFLGEVPLPPGVPNMALRPVMGVISGLVRAAGKRPLPSGASLDMLPEAALPADMSWASANPVIADALARASAAIESAGSRSVPEPVRDVVLAELANWDGEPRGPSRAWAESAISGIPAEHQGAGRLALLTALASYQVDQSAIDAFRRGRPDDASLVELTSWASLAAARRAASWIPVAAAEAAADKARDGLPDFSAAEPSIATYPSRTIISAAAAYSAGPSRRVVARPSTYRLNMQNAAAIRTVSWISRSVAPAARAVAISSACASLPPRCTAAAMRSRAASFGVTGAVARSARTSSTSAIPSGNCAAANAACEAVQ